MKKNPNSVPGVLGEAPEIPEIVIVCFKKRKIDSHKRAIKNTNKGILRKNNTKKK